MGGVIVSVDMSYSFVIANDCCFYFPWSFMARVVNELANAAVSPAAPSVVRDARRANVFKTIWFARSSSRGDRE
jgi:hypothetical protein